MFFYILTKFLRLKCIFLKYIFEIFNSQLYNNDNDNSNKRKNCLEFLLQQHNVTITGPACFDNDLSLSFIIKHSNTIFKK